MKLGMKSGLIKVGYQVKYDQNGIKLGVKLVSSDLKSISGFSYLQQLAPLLAPLFNNLILVFFIFKFNIQRAANENKRKEINQNPSKISN